MGRPQAQFGRGPFTTSDVSPGDRYELSEGHPIHCAPGGGDHAHTSSLGALVIESDPDVTSAGVDAGFALSENTMRAPDVSVGVPDAPGWVQGVPPLAIEYAAKGQDEAELDAKIREFLGAGTRWVWVVRLTTPRHVEVHEKGKRIRRKNPGDLLDAPGVLRNPVRVEALFDRRIAMDSAFRNLLERQGYSSLEDVRHEGKQVALLAVLDGRQISISKRARARILSEKDERVLDTWLRRAGTVDSTRDLFRG